MYGHLAVLSLIVLAWWLAVPYRETRAARRQRQAQCLHEWRYVSAWDEGWFWNRHCPHCKLQEAVMEDDQVNYLREQYWREVCQTKEVGRTLRSRISWRPRR